MCALQRATFDNLVEWMWKKNDRISHCLFHREQLSHSREKSKVFFIRTVQSATRADFSLCLLFFLESRKFLSWMASPQIVFYFFFFFSNKCNQFRLPCELCPVVVEIKSIASIILYSIPTGHVKRKPMFLHPTR